MLKCKNCGYVGYTVCMNCGKTEVSCRCGSWEGQCPKCKEQAPKGDKKE